MNALAPAAVLAMLSACAAPPPDPAPATPAPSAETNDTTLLADYAESRVLEVDMQGKVVWSFGEVTGPWGVERLDDDHVLVTEFAASRVREYDRQGKLVWTFATRWAVAASRRSAR